MRSERIATCTSGEPVSPFLVAYSEMSAVLRSAVIDIGLVLTKRGSSGRCRPGCRPGGAMTKAGEGYPTPDLRADIVDRAAKRQLFVGALAGRTLDVGRVER